MSPFDHVDDYPEIPVSVASTQTALKTGTWRSVRPVLAERTAPCSAGCPAGIGIPAYLDLVNAGRIEEAFRAVTTRNPFPRITGRVCPHDCEDACNLGALGGEPVSIRAVERWLGDATASLPHPAPATTTRWRVAVVGSGPAGLSAAFYLRRSGHEVTVFERRERAGGILRYGIPEYRLPAEIVDAEVARLEAMGITIQTGVALGTEVTLQELEEAYAAVFVATGAWNERELDIVGGHLLIPGLAFLEAASRGEATLPGSACAVVGGGNTAMDVARMLRKLGADVTVLYRRTAAEMPAIPEEYERAVSDGVGFEFLTMPRAVVKIDDGLVATLEIMRLGAPDRSGRRRPEPTGVFHELRFDAVFSAVGETADLAPLPAAMQRDDGWLDVRRDGSTPEPRVFAGGDLATGPASVIEAIVAGRRAARTIDAHFGLGGSWEEETQDTPVGPDDVNGSYASRQLRASEPSPRSSEPFAEDTLTLDHAQVLIELERCYSCGHCNACGTCFVFCPDGAIRWEAGPVVDLEFCKGCGICVAECPGHAMILINEREVANV